MTQSSLLQCASLDRPDSVIEKTNEILSGFSPEDQKTFDDWFNDLFLDGMNAEERKEIQSALENIDDNTHAIVYCASRNKHASVYERSLRMRNQFAILGEIVAQIMLREFRRIVEEQELDVE